MKSNKFLILVFILGILSIEFGCRKKEEIPCIGKPVKQSNIQGQWKQDYNFTESTFVPPDNFLNVTFYNDSFKLEVEHITDMIFPSGCPYGVWQEYAKGKYQLNNGNVYFSGVYCDSVFTEKTSGCYNIGMYKDTFRISFCKDTLKMYGLAKWKQNLPENYRKVNLLKE